MPIRRKDHTPPNFRIDETKLTIELGEEGKPTFFIAESNFFYDGKLDLIPNFVLHGREINTDDEYFQIQIDGKLLKLGTDYQIEKSGDDQILTIFNPPEVGTLQVNTKLNPWINTSSAGIYASDGKLVTQGESEGFRRNTFYVDRPDNLATFTTIIIGDPKIFPRMLAAGTVIQDVIMTDTLELDSDKRAIIYEMDTPIPAYLWAMSAGNFHTLQGTYTSKSGKVVDTYIHVDPKDLPKAHFSLETLNWVLNWFEEHFDIEYDLDNYHIVGVNDFNAGAMENKGFNIFNAADLLFDPRLSTDSERIRIFLVIAHEFSHNIFGNRITINDWFHLFMKEALASQMEKFMTCDQYGYAVRRIEHVDLLISRQFPEADGPNAHAVRQNEIGKISNFYTMTTYEKGEELFHTLARVISSERQDYIDAMKNYVQKRLGTATTLDDIFADLEEATGLDLEQFKLWFDEKATPELRVSEEYNPDTKEYKLHVKQNMNPPFWIPIDVGLLDSNGVDMVGTVRCDLRENVQTFTFSDISEKPVLSFLRDFTAPVKVVETPIGNEQLKFLFQHDSDPVNRWMSGRKLKLQALQEMVEQVTAGRVPIIPEYLVTAFHNILVDDQIEKQMISELLDLPSLTDYVAVHEQVDIDALSTALRALVQQLGTELEDDWNATYREQKTSTESFNREDMERRALQNTALGFLVATQKEEYIDMAKQQLSDFTMTNFWAAALPLATKEYPGWEATSREVLDSMIARWPDEEIITLKWILMHALSIQSDSLERLIEMMSSDRFNFDRPNHIYSSVRAMAEGNLSVFHRKDGKGYQFLADAVIRVDRANPELAARIVKGFQDWKKFDPGRQMLMINNMNRIRNIEQLSEETREVLDKMLIGAPNLEMISLRRSHEYHNSNEPSDNDMSEEEEVEFRPLTPDLNIC